MILLRIYSLRLHSFTSERTWYDKKLPKETIGEQLNRNISGTLTNTELYVNMAADRVKTSFSKIWRYEAMMM